MTEQQEASSAFVEALQHNILVHTVEQIIERGHEAAGCDERSLEVVCETVQVANALQRLQLHSLGSSEPATAHDAGPGEASDEDATASAFAGACSKRLGVSEADLLEEALPPECERQQAAAAVLPALEAALRQRCAEVAAACGYGATSDFSALPDHIWQLQAEAAAAAVRQADAQRKAAAQAGEVVGLLVRASRMLADILERHKLQERKAVDEAQARALHASCTFLRDKLRVVQLQLQEATYTASTVQALRQVAQEVEGSLAEAAAQLQQATARLAQYQALGPVFAALAAEHGSVLEALGEAEYELQEVEQFRALAAETG